jgi:hypothetical protein
MRDAMLTELGCELHHDELGRRCRLRRSGTGSKRSRMPMR